MRASARFYPEPILTDPVDVSLGASQRFNMSSLQFDPCPGLGPVMNGKWDCSNYNLFGSECVVKCDTGFKYSGDSELVRSCSNTATWSNESEPGKCEPISCPAIAEPENGKVKCEGKGTETACIISCVSGYYLDSGPDSNDQLYSIHCQSNERWDRPITGLDCRPLICPPLQLDSTVVAVCGEGESNLVGTECQIQCAMDKAVPQIGLADTVKCVPDEQTVGQAKWDQDALLVCKVLQCIRPEVEDKFIKVTSDVETKKTAFFPDETMTFSCLPGFELAGSGVIRCDLADDSATVSWSDMPPLCKRTQCDQLEPVERGQITCSNEAFFNSTCRLSCDPSFRPGQAGLLETRCQSSQTWSPSELSDCVQMECKPLTVPQNVRMSQCDTVDGSTCTFRF